MDQMFAIITAVLCIKVAVLPGFLDLADGYFIRTILSHSDFDVLFYVTYGRSLKAMRKIRSDYEGDSKSDTDGNDSLFCSK